MSSTDLTETLTSVRNLGNTFLNMSKALADIVTSDPELIQIVTQIAEVYHLSLAPTSSTNIDSTPPEILIPKENPFHELKESLKGNPQNDFPLGTEIPDIWTDEFGAMHNNPFIVMQYREQLFADGRTRFGVELSRKYVDSQKRQFSALHSNHYITSDIAQYLSTQSGGYISGCSSALVDVLADQSMPRLTIPVRQRFKRTIYDNHDCFFYLPSGSNLFPDWTSRQHWSEKDQQTVTRIPDGTLWAYFREKLPIFLDFLGHPQNCFLRSNDHVNKSRVWTVGHNGYDYLKHADEQSCLAPVCTFIHL